MPGSRMFGDFPPSSRVTPFSPRAACSMIAAPTPSEPVKETRSTCGWVVRCWPTDGPSPMTTLRTPGGMPASSNSSPIQSVVSGVRGEGSRTEVQPAARAAPNLKTARLIG